VTEAELQVLVVAHGVQHEAQPVKTVYNTASLVVVAQADLSLARLMASASLLVVGSPMDLES
jgi:hypothetical protein